MLFSVVSSLFLFGKEVAFAFAGLQSCQSFHNRLFAALLKAPMLFFDSTPIGRIMVRFSADVDNLDVQLAPLYSHVAMNIFLITATLIVLTSASAWFLLPLLVVAAVLVRLQRYYLGASRELNRLKSVAQSPAISLVSETLSGLVTVRAYCLERHFTKRLYCYLRDYQRANLLSVDAARWVGVRNSVLGAVTINVLFISAIVFRSSFTHSAVALSLVYGLQMTAYILWMIRDSAEVTAAVPYACSLTVSRLRRR